MQEQIDKDLAPFLHSGISQSELYQKFVHLPPELFVIKFIISDNTVCYETFFNEPNLDYRIESYKNTFEEICHRFVLPNMEFYILLHDGFGQSDFFGDHLSDFPLFVMSRTHFPGREHRSILIPDFENLKENYQVLENGDVLSHNELWKKKKPQMVWRGSTAQNVWLNEPPFCVSSTTMNDGNCRLFSRFVLCELSNKSPHLINAKYTHLIDLDKTAPFVKAYQGAWLSFQEQFAYKYHILLNGNAAPYSGSCWKLFTNSLIFLPQSFVVQWYSDALKPYVHYVPVNENLSDLIEKLRWAQKHDLECELIAKNCREFAVKNLKKEDSLIYIYFLLKKYGTCIY